MRHDRDYCTNLLKLLLIHDDEAISISRPLNNSIVILAFSVQHHSELLFRSGVDQILLEIDCVCVCVTCIHAHVRDF
jgi:hypothetical protein